MDDLKLRLENSKTKIKIGKLESDLGIPQSVLSKWLKGSRDLPQKYIEPLTNALTEIEGGIYVFKTENKKEKKTKEVIEIKTEKQIDEVSVLLTDDTKPTDIVNSINEVLEIKNNDILAEKVEPKIVKEEVVIVRKEHTKKVVDSVGVYASMLNEFKSFVDGDASKDKFERLKLKAKDSKELLPTQKSGIVDRVNNYLNGTYKK